MDVTAEAIEALNELLQGERKIRTLQESNPNPDRQLLYRDSAGVVQLFDLPAPPLDVEAHTIASLVAAAERFDCPDHPATFWVRHECVVVVLGDDGQGHRANRITMPLQPSPLFQLLKLPDVGKAFAQKTLLKFLTVQCGTAEVFPETFPGLVRALRFEFSDVQNAEHGGPGNDRMGREIRSEVTGADQLPDGVAFVFHPYPDLQDELPGLEVEIRFAVDADGMDKTITLQPIPGSYRAAVVTATNALRDRIAVDVASESATILLGTPG